MGYIPFSDVFGRIWGCRWGYRIELVREEQNGDTLSKYGTKFSLKSLEKATKNFSNRLSRDGFGSCYKGTLENGTLVEVEVHRESQLSLDFFSGIRIMSRICHQNVVEFIGYCDEAKHRIIVCKFMGDYDLDHLLFNTDSQQISWPTRASICLGVARGFKYLHQGINPRVVHCNIKPKNVVVDDNFNAKITNFNVAVQISDDCSDGCGVLGTFGLFSYMAPELFITGRWTEKADVYSFGVLLLEVITGRHNRQFRSGGSFTLIDWVWELQESGRVQECVDPTLSEFPEDEVVRFLSVALFCVQGSAKLRPSMFEVFHMLSGAYDLSNRTLTNPLQSICDELNYPSDSMGDELNSTPADSNFDDLNSTPGDSSVELKLNHPADSSFTSLADESVFEEEQF